MNPTDKEKVLMYERLLHLIHINRTVCLNTKNTNALLDNISSWSYAHRSGNGMLSEEEQVARINTAFYKLVDLQ